jgi:hypothetical protein
MKSCPLCGGTVSIEELERELHVLRAAKDAEKTCVLSGGGGGGGPVLTTNLPSSPYGGGVWTSGSGGYASWNSGTASPTPPAHDTWQVVTNREMTCAKCGLVWRPGSAEFADELRRQIIDLKGPIDSLASLDSSERLVPGKPEE